MKNLLIILLTFTVLGILGCSDSLVTPNSGSTASKFQMKMISLPERSAIKTESESGAEKLINGDKGGVLNYSDRYISASGGYVKINSKLTVPAGAYQGERLLEQEAGADFAGADFSISPATTFAIPLSCDFDFEGLDLSGIDPGSVKFGCVAPDGSFEPCQVDDIRIEPVSGKLHVRNARLLHFSRYSFFH